MKTLWKLTKEATRYKGLYVLSVLATFGLTIEKVRSSNEELMMSYIKRKETISIWYKLRIQQISDYIVKCKKTACNCCRRSLLLFIMIMLFQPFRHTVVIIASDDGCRNCLQFRNSIF